MRIIVLVLGSNQRGFANEECQTGGKGNATGEEVNSTRCAGKQSSTTGITYHRHEQ